MSGLRIGAFTCSYVKGQLFSKRQTINRFEIIRNFSLTTTRNMKYVQFVYKNKPDEVRVGYLEGDNVVDINKCDPTIPSTLLEILKKGYIPKVVNLKSTKPSGEPLSCVDLAAPITGMDKVMCIGLNYADHCREQNLEPPKVPMIFSKFASTVIGQNEPLRLRTAVTKKVDWEVELVVVIGEKCSSVKAADADKYVFGYTVAQDISARDWQKEKNAGQFLLGKSQDTFCPIGPCITTSDEIGDPNNLAICCSVNGVVKQTSNTCNLIYKIPEVIERLSSIMTLLPGDIILTGTPGGVGVHRKPSEFLNPGDVLSSTIENIGTFDIKVEKF
ncbi:oxaloacetate tautomerase FAHD2A, mitochondrial-like [Anticarsia gemmatalis]|uniref:oxaloacetate tautomerase FAHD2A, mitochondrial-like n=1 Tax=Anticarsia gemmatalis TaxID=129554 RepID=UPI003F769EE0